MFPTPAAVSRWGIAEFTWFAGVHVGYFTIVLAVVTSCTPVPPPTLDQGRPCYLGAVPADEVTWVTTWAPGALEGDLLINASCDEVQTERELNHVRRATR